MKVYFVEELCKGNIDNMKKQIMIHRNLGAEIVLVYDFKDVPKGVPYYDGKKITLNN